MANRLKTTLKLRKVEPRPPLHPCVYAKLYAYFDRTLTSSEHTPQTNTKFLLSKFNTYQKFTSVETCTRGGQKQVPRWYTTDGKGVV
jgi:hypothetical protein